MGKGLAEGPGARWEEGLDAPGLGKGSRGQGRGRSVSVWEDGRGAPTSRAWGGVRGLSLRAKVGGGGEAHGRGGCVAYSQVFEARVLRAKEPAEPKGEPGLPRAPAVQAQRRRWRRAASDRRRPPPQLQGGGGPGAAGSGGGARRGGRTGAEEGRGSGAGARTDCPR